jgi:type IV pilus assembly protein PilY1
MQGSIIKLASLGGTSDISDSRFFNEPSIVRTLISQAEKMTNMNGATNEQNTLRNEVVRYKEKASDVIVIGSGDVTKLLKSDTLDRLFVLYDPNIHHSNIAPYIANNMSSIHAPEIQLQQLFKYGDFLYETYLNADRQSQLAMEENKNSGWYMDLADHGEKVNSTALVINGIIYFNSVTANNNANGTVKSWLYGIDLTTRLPVDLSIHCANNSLCDEKKSLLGEGIVPEPSLILLAKKIGEVDNSQVKLIVGKTIIPLNFSLKTIRTYLYVSE